MTPRRTSISPSAQSVRTQHLKVVEILNRVGKENPPIPRDELPPEFEPNILKTLPLTQFAIPPRT